VTEAVQNPRCQSSVSKILWHFTGGPLWDSKRNKQCTKLKPPERAYEALTSILKTKELRVGQYHEVVKVLIPKRTRWNSKQKRNVAQKNVLAELNSAAVNCLADIPVIHLSYHAQRYGRFAIGFHRASAIRHGFTPVMYALHGVHVLRSIYRGFAQLDDINSDYLSLLITDAEDEIGDAECKHGHRVEFPHGGSAQYLRTGLEDIEESVWHAKKAFERMLAFIKTFEPREFGSIYCEREWRSIKPFKFTYDDVAMIVVPKADGDRSYFEEFTALVGRKLRLPRKIPIVPWEDLIEH
jgi:hypothetical protein